MTSLLLATAKAASTTSSTSADLFSTLQPFLLIIVFFAIMYFLIIRPQKKREKETANMRNSIEAGDEIITIGGIVGKVVNIKDEYVTIESGADKVKFRIVRSAIQNKLKSESDE